MRLPAGGPATGRRVETTTLERGPRRVPRKTARSLAEKRAARTGTPPPGRVTIQALYGVPAGVGARPRSRIAARPPLPTARTSPGAPRNAIRSVLGFARSASARRSTAGAPAETWGGGAGLAFAAGADVCAKGKDEEPARRTAAAPSAIAAIPAATPSATSVTGVIRRACGMSTAQMLPGEIRRPSCTTPSASRAGSWTTGMSGTVVTTRSSR